ncbi:hypothetical protein BACOV975_00365 [Bacteroides ovatus V975]|jgi:hypothetical protein|nr:hypothetical protein BACOV975_00365 [Bacteroides ovatus V975]
MSSADTCGQRIISRQHTRVSLFQTKMKKMEVISIEARTFEEMKQALSSIIRNIHDQKGKRPEDSLEGWIDNQEACIMMDISPRKLLSLRSTGKIPYSKIDRKIYYRKKDINMYMEKLLQKGNY